MDIKPPHKGERCGRIENASFSGVHNNTVTPNYTEDFSGGYIKKGETMDATEFIRRAINLHHKTWVISPLNEVIELLETALKGKANEKPNS